MPYFRLNSGRNSAYGSNGYNTGRLRLIMDYHFAEEFNCSLNVGYEHQSSRKIGDVKTKDSLLFGAGLL